MVESIKLFPNLICNFYLPEVWIIKIVKKISLVSTSGSLYCKTVRLNVYRLIRRIYR